MERSSSRLRLFRQFDPKACFVYHANPGDLKALRKCYEEISIKNPEVLYVIHILPERNSQVHSHTYSINSLFCLQEFVQMKKLTAQYALIGQGKEPSIYLLFARSVS